MRAIFAAILMSALCEAGELPVANGGFGEAAGNGAAGWKWWSRTGVGSASRTADEHHGDGHSVCLRHEGERDWAFSSEQRLAAKPGDACLASAWVKVAKGDVVLAVVALRGGKTLRWDIGSASAGVGKDWVRIEALAEVPEGCDQIYVRFVGQGDTLAWVDDVTLQTTILPKPADKPKVQGYATERIREKLGRGLVALPVAGGKVYLGWRLLAADPPDAAFDVYRRTGDAPPVKLNAEPIRKTTDFVDATASAGGDYAYAVREAKEKAEYPPEGVKPSGGVGGEGVKPSGGADYLSIRLQGDHTFMSAGIADLDGVGRYDFVIKQPASNIDPYDKYWKRSPSTYQLEAYRGVGQASACPIREKGKMPAPLQSDSQFLWRHDLGWAIEQGIWYSPYIVYDLDGDGKAEVAVKTGEGDPRDAEGRVQAGPEWLTILDGMTGKAVTQVPWPSREGFGSGERGYNYASRNQMCVAYLDGKTPCLVVERGTYNLIKLVAYEFRDRRLRELWRWDNSREPRRYWGQGAHWMHAVDLDGDGRDEVVIGSAVIDDNGTALWSTGLGHPDHAYVGHIDPALPGLQIYYGIEPGQAKNTMCLVDAKTGKILWGHDQPTTHIHSSGLVSDIDPKHPGSECYSGERDFKDKRWLRDCKGNVLSTKDLGGLAPRAVYWDADPQRELLIGGKIVKFEGPTLPPRIEGLIVAVADILGDWREEIITSLPGELRIYTTAIPAADRRPCLMQDPLYRLDVAVATMGYYQAPMTSYDLGTGK